MAEENKVLNEEQKENVDTNDSETKVELKYTQKDFDSAAGNIRKGTEERLLKKYNVSTQDELQAKLDKLNEYEQSKLTEEEKLEQQRLEIAREVEKKQNELASVQEQLNTETLKGNLRDLNIDTSKLEDAVILIKAKGIELTDENIKSFVDSRPEWQAVKEQKGITQIGTTGNEQSTKEVNERAKIRAAIRGR